MIVNGSLNTEVGFKGDGLLEANWRQGHWGRGQSGAREPHPAEILL